MGVYVTGAIITFCLVGWTTGGRQLLTPILVALIWSLFLVERIIVILLIVLGIIKK